ncbi:unnamed protein product [Vitrella brassicaformis CCMP3155]|uniref:Uncharacterized protein n=2 Tax=Vitrella brassicaformis TaxID=1169539 RepID=A0A0G4GXJ5_VITBC|nr:unnamed protein product [Vitrella brassicaformis CCMP3155]|eukprot:CEM35767.1 unnamed protein product [Vitrella brassicaformis CCMP3155]
MEGLSEALLPSGLPMHFDARAWSSDSLEGLSADMVDSAVSSVTQKTFTGMAHGLLGLSHVLTALSDALPSTAPVALRADMANAARRLANPAKMEYVPGVRLSVDGVAMFEPLNTFIDEWKHQRYQAAGRALGSMVRPLSSVAEALPDVSVPNNTAKIQLFAKGLLEGFGLDYPLLWACIKDTNELDEDIAIAIALILKKDRADVKAGLKVLADALDKKLLPSLRDCKAGEHDLEKIEEALATLSNPHSFALHVGKDLLINGRDIFHEMNQAVIAYGNDDWEGLGEDVGMALGKLLIGVAIPHPPGPSAISPDALRRASYFLAGVAQGLPPRWTALGGRGKDQPVVFGKEGNDTSCIDTVMSFVGALEDDWAMVLNKTTFREGVMAIVDDIKTYIPLIVKECITNTTALRKAPLGFASKLTKLARDLEARMDGVSIDSIKVERHESTDKLMVSIDGVNVSRDMQMLVRHLPATSPAALLLAGQATGKMLYKLTHHAHHHDAHHSPRSSLVSPPNRLTPLPSLMLVNEGAPVAASAPTDGEQDYHPSSLPMPPSHPLTSTQGAKADLGLGGDLGGGSSSQSPSFSTFFVVWGCVLLSVVGVAGVWGVMRVYGRRLRKGLRGLSGKVGAAASTFVHERTDLASDHEWRNLEALSVPLSSNHSHVCE